MRKSMAPSTRLSSFRPPARISPHVADAPTNEPGKPKPDEGEKDIEVKDTLKRKMPPQFSSSIRPAPSARSTAPTIPTTPTASTSESNDSQMYFSIVWRKPSTKKHKNWDGDGVLVVSGKTCKLLDMEAKEIGKSNMYSVDQLTTLQEGQSLSLSGKEIEVTGRIEARVFQSGACFLSAKKSVENVPEIPASKSVPQATPFKSPMLGDQIKKTRPQVAQPRFDIHAPGVLVMPRPSAEHQRLFSKGAPVVDVVIDPYLSSCLRPHQQEGVKFLYECVMELKEFNGAGAILADEMGLGKTLQTIALIWTLLKQNMYGGAPVIKRALIVCPASLILNWQKEFRKWLGDERCRTFAVLPSTPVEDFTLSTIYPVVIIGYERFRQAATLLSKANIGIIVCDEGHRLKNSNIKTAQAIQLLPTRRRIILSGTPIQNDLQEFFSMVDFVNPGVLGTYSAFKKVFEDPILLSRQKNCSRSHLLIGESRSAELSKLTGMFILRRTQEINQKYLPPKTEMVLFCPPSPLQTSIYKAALASAAVRSCFVDSGANSQLLCILTLRKLCNSPRLLFRTITAKISDTTAEEDDDDHMEIDRSVFHSLERDLSEAFPANYSNITSIDDPDSAKMVTLLSLLKTIRNENANNKVVFVSNFTQILDMVAAMCQANNYQLLRLDGRTPVSKRQGLVDQFNLPHSPYFIFLLSAKSGGAGLNLVGASKLILFDIDWNPATDAQAMARIWRDGQKKPVTIYRLLTTGTLEEKMYQRQMTKLSLSETLLDDRKSTHHFSQDELRDLFTLHEDTSCLTHDLLECDCQNKTIENADELDEHVLTSLSEKMQTNEQENNADFSNFTLKTTTSTKAKETKANIMIDELKEWDHFKFDQPSSYLDEAIDDKAVCTVMRAGTVSFVFRRMTTSVEETS